MKKIINILLFIFLFQSAVYCQKETSWWYFGYNAGLNFNALSNATASDGTVVPNMPEAIVGPVNTSEGCFAVSTYDGQLLFSSDGITVYNKLGNIMANGTGLLGNSSATQSGIAIPKPGSLTEYYIVTVPADNNTDINKNGIRYSVVDMSLNGGLGGVIVASKNKIIKSGVVDENIAAVPNTNGRDYWLIHRTKQTFYVWAVTSSGISSTTHQSITNTQIITAGGYVGEIIMSSDYTKLVTCTWTANQVISAIFNPSTGFLSGVQVFTGTPLSTPYGGAFSPNNAYIYMTRGYNVTATGAAATAYRNTWAGLRANSNFTTLPAPITNFRKGLDNRLYGISFPRGPVGGGQTKHLYVVMNPDAGGTIIKYFPNYLKSTTSLGLPTFAMGFIRIIPKEQPFACAAHTRTYGVEVDLTGGNAPTKLTWDFGDGTPLVTQTVTTATANYNQLHSYANAGVYTVTITPYKGDGTALPPITMLANIVYCSLKSNRMTRSDLLNSKQQQ